MSFLSLLPKIIAFHSLKYHTRNILCIIIYWKILKNAKDLFYYKVDCAHQAKGEVASRV